MDGFFDAVLVGEMGLFGDFVFSNSSVSQSVAKYVTIDFSSGFSTLTSEGKKEHFRQCVFVVWDQSIGVSDEYNKTT